MARYAYAMYPNLSVFHHASCKYPLCANRASLTSLPGDVTRITIESPGVRWEPGQHVFLTCHSIAPLQCHPSRFHPCPAIAKWSFSYAQRREPLSGTPIMHPRMVVFWDLARQHHSLPSRSAPCSLMVLMGCTDRSGNLTVSSC